jgi:hypothetical protein
LSGIASNEKNPHALAFGGRERPREAPPVWRGRVRDEKNLDHDPDALTFGARVSGKSGVVELTVDHVSLWESPRAKGHGGADIVIITVINIYCGSSQGESRRGRNRVLG